MRDLSSDSSIRRDWIEAGNSSESQKAAASATVCLTRWLFAATRAPEKDG
jgi:hypothetical protein